MTDLRLADAFPQATLADWRSLVEKALKGGDFERRLVARSADGLKVGPLYTRANGQGVDALPGEAPMTRGQRPADGTGWEIAQVYAEPEPKAANAAILEDLAGGVAALTLRIAAPGQFGLPYEGGSISDALKGVHLDVCPVSLEAGEYTTDAACALIACWRQAGLSEALWKGAFNYDPLGTLAATGALYHPVDRALAIAGQFLSNHRHPGVTVLKADGRPYHEAGASEAEELAALLATLVAYLRAAESAGAKPADALPHIAIELAADADQLLTIGKLRAARRLVYRAAEASGAGPSMAKLRIAVTTSERMMGRRDPWVNMLRTTMACAAAAMGGADRITVLPFSFALGRPDAFARRLARNTHHVLMEESGLGRVADPAGGSFAVESLTAELAAKAWALFQGIEAKGGMAQALTGGFLRDKIAATAEARDKLIATGRMELTGASAFPKLGDDGVTAERHPAPLPADLNGVRMQPLKSRRLAEPFEALRDRADAFEKRTGKPPTVFLASLGPLSVHSTRTTWIANFLSAGGIAAIASEGFLTSTQAGEAFALSGAPVACLCSADAVYAELGEATTQLLKTAGAKHVLLAGRPKEQEAALNAAGVDTFVFAGCDAVAVLTALQKVLGA